MKVVCLLLVLLLCSTQVNALKCRVCNGSDHEEDCKRGQECPAESNFCKFYESGEQIFSECAQLCDDSLRGVWCCSEDNCTP